MSTENEEWRENSFNNEENANREGNNKSYNRDGDDQSHPQRPYRPRFNPNAEASSDRPQRSYGGGGYYNERPQRPSYRDGGDQQRPYRPRFNPNADGGNDRPQRPYSGGGGYYNDRPQRPSYNNYRDGGDQQPQRPYRPRFNPNNDGGDYQQRPSYNQGGGYRPRYGNDGGDRPQQRPHYGNNQGGGYRPRFNDNDGGGYRPRFNPNQQQGGGYRPQPQRPQQRPHNKPYNPNAKYSKKKQIEYKEAYVDPNEPIRLNKYLANAGVCSRREADEFITAGVVSVNGVVVTELGTKIKRGDAVMFHNEPVSIERKIYVLLNKPKDTVTTSDDPQERRTVLDLVKGACTERIYPVGRLDRNTTGVLLLTNDGDLASKLTHPKYLKKKIYHVQLDKNLTKADMDQIAAGIQLEDGEIHADAISYTDEMKKNSVGIEIHSGKNRIVRRIFETLGYRVTKLDRVFFAGLTKKGLRRGDWRYLTEAEVNYLRMGSFE